MDNTFGTIVSYRPDIKVVDATLRDGGLVNNFGFTTEFVKDLYKTNIAAGVDYMEFGAVTQALASFLCPPPQRSHS